MSASLRRGAACLTCRRRKIKCSGTRPVCDQCRRVGQHVFCQYGEIGRPSHIDALEREIARLKSRLQELEPPEPIALTDPYTSQDTDTQMASTETITGTEEGPSYVGGPGTPHSDAAGRVAANDDYDLDTADPTSAMDIEAPLDFDLEASPASNLEEPLPESTPPPSWWELEKPFEERVRKAINDLAPNAREFGFFLDLTKELRTSPGVNMNESDQRHDQSQHQDEEHCGLHKTLLRNVVVLWAAHLSRDTDLKVQENSVLRRTLALLSDAVADISTSTALLYVLQAELALAYYFVRDARWYEARYHANTAGRLVLDFGIVDVATAQAEAEGSAGRAASAFRYYPGSGWYAGVVAHLDHAICVDAAHSVCILDQALACFLSIKPVFSTEITDRMFPYSERDVTDTTAAFFLEAHATSLLYRATAICNSKEPSSASAPELELTISSLLDYVDTTRTVANSGRGLDGRAFVTLKSLLLMARIQLKLPFVDKETTARDELVEALIDFADTMANADVLAIRPFNPIMASVWITMAHLLNVELQRAREPDQPFHSEAVIRLREVGSQLIQQLLMLGDTIPLRSFMMKVESMMPLMVALQGCA